MFRFENTQKMLAEIGHLSGLPLSIPFQGFSALPHFHWATGHHLAKNSSCSPSCTRSTPSKSCFFPPCSNCRVHGSRCGLGWRRDLLGSSNTQPLYLRVWKEVLQLIGFKPGFCESLWIHILTRKEENKK